MIALMHAYPKTGWNDEWIDSLSERLMRLQWFRLTNGLLLVWGRTACVANVILRAVQGVKD